MVATRTESSSSSSSSSSSISPSSTQSTSIATVTEQQLTSYATDSSGVQIQVALNTTLMPMNGAVLAQISLHNTHDQNLSLSVESSSNQTFGNWSEYESFCGDTGQFGTLFGYALFSGHYVAQNFSLAPAPLQLSPQVPLPCVGAGGEYGTVIFLPNSSIGVINGGMSHQVAEDATTDYCVNYPNGSTGCGPGGGIIGYWDTSALVGDGTLASPDFVRLPTGQYTLAVMDAWGGAVFATFQVTSKTVPPVACPSTTTCPSFSKLPASPLKVESIRATQYLCGDCVSANGQSYVSFEVVFQNTGSSLVYMLSGPALITLSVPANSTVLRPVTSSVCIETSGTLYLSQGQNFTWDGPSCTTGSVKVSFTFDWGLSYNDIQNTTTISAELVFP